MLINLSRLFRDRFCRKMNRPNAGCITDYLSTSADHFSCPSGASGRLFRQHRRASAVEGASFVLGTWEILHKSAAAQHQLEAVRNNFGSTAEVVQTGEGPAVSYSAASSFTTVTREIVYLET